MHLDKQGLVAVWLAVVGWATTGIFIRNLGDMSPVAIAAGRSLVALVVVVAVVIASGYRYRLRETVRQPVAWCLSILVTLFYLISVWAFQLISVAETVLFLNTSPIFVIVYSIICKKPLPVAVKFGCAIAFSGLLIICIPAISVEKTSLWERITGYGLALSGAIIMASYAIICRHCSNQIRGLHAGALAVLAFFTSVCVLFSWLIFSGENPEYRQLVTTDTVVNFLGLGALATALPTICYSMASQRLSSVVATSMCLMTPVVAAIVAIIWLQEIPSIWFWMGTAFIMAGVLLTTWSQNQDISKVRSNKTLAAEA